MQVFPAPSVRSAPKKRGSNDANGKSSRDGPEADTTSDDGSGGDAGEPKRSRTSGAPKPRKPSHVMIRVSQLYWSYTLGNKI